ncbi:proteasome regulatory particle base subunit [Balamuthia mandrillaris]
MATGDVQIFEDLKNQILYTDSAVAGEAAGLAMGLIMLGSASESALADMLTYAHDTQHEKIIRGLAIGIALIMYGREEGADTLIEQLTRDKDPILRYGGMYTIALAYAGTANNNAIRRLLHVAVSDVSDDVRRAAVTALGFLLFKQPKQCPKLVSLLAESYNPHVRYGATLAVGISCAGTGLKEAVDLLEPLANDPVDFVRQGALIALAMVLIQTSNAQEPRVEKIRKLFADKISDKHEDIMCKFGACLASGIIDASGRNSTISPQSIAGHSDMTAIVGLAVFTQYWYWHPLAHFLCLAFRPTALISLNKDLKMPVFKFKSNARPSLFAYPPKVKPPETKAPKKVQAAELSITKKAKIRALKKEKERQSAMDVEATKKAEEEEEQKKKQQEEQEKREKEKEKEKEQEPEPEFQILENPARVTVQQVRYLSFDADERYTPIKQEGALGIVLLKDSRPGEEEVFVTPAKPPTGEHDDEENEPEPPEPFEYDPEKEKGL